MWSVALRPIAVWVADQQSTLIAKLGAKEPGFAIGQSSIETAVFSTTVRLQRGEGDAYWVVRS